MQEIALKKEKKISGADIVRNNVDDILLMIESDISYKEIASKYGIVQSLLSDILNLEYRARKDIALEIAAEKRIKDAENYLLSINEDDTNATLKKKTSLSEFNIYLAKVKCKKFDLNYREDRQETNNNIITPQLTLKVINNSQNQLKIDNNEENN